MFGRTRSQRPVPACHAHRRLMSTTAIASTDRPFRALREPKPKVHCADIGTTSTNSGMPTLSSWPARESRYRSCSASPGIVRGSRRSPRDRRQSCRRRPGSSPEQSPTDAGAPAAPALLHAQTQSRLLRDANVHSADPQLRQPGRARVAASARPLAGDGKHRVRNREITGTSAGLAAGPPRAGGIARLAGVREVLGARGPGQDFVFGWHISVRAATGGTL
jgi:hypothetical protein